MDSNRSTLSSRGLDNQPGENNCFLNCVIQALWHIDIFRESLHNLKDDSKTPNSIIEALQVIFDNYKFCDFEVLRPDYLRKVLARLNVDRFQLGQTNDAVECYEYILDKIHEHSTTNVDSATCEDDGCITHKKFTLTLINHLTCPHCNVTAEPEPLRVPLLYVTVAELVKEPYEFSTPGHGSLNYRFGNILRSVLANKEMCPGGCKNVIRNHCYLTNCPEIVSIGLTWSTKAASKSTIQLLLHIIKTRISLNDVFSKVLHETAAHTMINLSTIVVYYGMHYATFCYVSRYQNWILCDDAQIRHIGPQFEDVVKNCIRNCYQPVLLIYTNSSGKPMSPKADKRTQRSANGNHNPSKVATAQLIDIEDSHSNENTSKADSHFPKNWQGNTDDHYDGIDVLRSSATDNPLVTSRESRDEVTDAITSLQNWSALGNHDEEFRVRRDLRQDNSNKLNSERTRGNQSVINAWNDVDDRKQSGSPKYYDKRSHSRRKLSGSDTASNSSGKTDDAISFVTASTYDTHYTHDSKNYEMKNDRYYHHDSAKHIINASAPVSYKDEGNEKVSRKYEEKYNRQSSRSYQQNQDSYENKEKTETGIREAMEKYHELCQRLNSFSFYHIACLNGNRKLDDCVKQASCGNREAARELCDEALGYYSQCRLLDGLDKHLHRHVDEVMMYCSELKAKLDAPLTWR